MNDRSLSLLEQYDIEVLRTRKGRGTFVCETKQGNFTFQEYKGNPEKLKIQQAILKRIKELGIVKAEELLPTKEGQLFVKDSDGVGYILKTCCEGYECDIYNNRECAEAVQQLARLHHCMEGMQYPAIEEENTQQYILPPYSPLKEYEKHNRELMRVWSYLKKKGQKQVFEKRLQNSVEYFMEQGKQVADSWKQVEQTQDAAGLCHGDYQYHNIIHGTDGWHIVNFEKLQADDPVRDLYLFLRKVMEKNDWDVTVGRELLNAYEAIRNLNQYSKSDLYHRFLYPEKFWKIANFYYNSPKAWIPEKNLEKLEKVISQEKMKQKFIEEVF